MAKQVKMFNTGADYALSLIGGKWKPVILYLLAGHPRRTGELVKQLGTSHKVLSDQLRELNDAGIVARKSYNTIPRTLNTASLMKAKTYMLPFVTLTIGENNK